VEKSKISKSAEEEPILRPGLAKLLKASLEAVLPYLVGLVMVNIEDNCEIGSYLNLLYKIILANYIFHGYL